MSEMQNPPSPLYKGRIKAILLSGKLIYILALALSFAACSNKQAATDMATEGHMDSITVYCDEGFQELMDQEIRIYEIEYSDKHIHIIYTSEADALKRLTADSFAVVIVGRKLSEQERSDILHRTNLQAEEHTFATDAIAIIVDRKLDRNTMPYVDILSLLTNKSSAYNLVFEGNGSGVINYMFAQIARSSVRPSAYAAKNLNELVEYLQKDNKGIGFIPFSRTSDEHDTTAQQLLKKVKLLYVSRIDSTGRLVSSTASQSEIADGSYPLDRPINIISHTMEEKVGTGFVNFLYGDKSGRIILKAGLVPTIMPQRVVNVNTDTIK
jgi:phosphate transport system substrate-binding protein